MKTPQTDDLARGNHVVPTEWAEQLERERDQAREKIKRQAERICQLEGATNHAGGTPLSIALRERDEANYFLNELAEVDGQLKVRIEEICESLRKTEKERDELKEIASELAITASHCLGWHENKNPNQITSALSRWLKISTHELE